MSMNEKKYPSTSVQMFYDVQYFSDSLGCDRGSKVLAANFVYEGGHVLHVEYNNDTRALSIEILE